MKCGKVRMPLGRYGSMKKIVITGCTGAIGMAIIEQCLKQNIQVLAITHKNSTRSHLIPEHKLLTILELDLEEYASTEFRLEGSYDVFYHLAWNGTFGNTRNDYFLQVKNIEHALEAVTLAKRLGCHTFVGAGSQAEYGLSNSNLNQETKTNPTNGYGVAKLCAGQMTRLKCEELGIKHIWARILSIYGPYDGANSLIMSALSKLHKDENMALTKGEQIWDYLYSKDCANALILLGKTGINGKVYCLGSGEKKELKQYLIDMKKIMGSKSELLFGEVPYANHQVMHLCADISELVKDTGFKVEYTFEEGIKELLQNMR